MSSCSVDCFPQLLLLFLLCGASNFASFHFVFVLYTYLVFVSLQHKFILFYFVDLLPMLVFFAFSIPSFTLLILIA